MIKTFYINLDENEVRKAHIESELAGAGISGERVSGIVGRNLPSEIACNFLFAECLSPGQVGCYASHLKVMQIISKRGISAALVLEDDAILPPDLLSIIAATLPALPPGWDIVRLCSPPKRAVKPIAMLCGGRQLVQYSRIPLSSAGYLVSRAGASKLLRPRQVQVPIDVEIARSWNLELSVFGITPPPIRQARSALATTIPNYIPVSHSKLPNLRRVAYNVKCLGLYWWGVCLMQNATRRLRRNSLLTPIDSQSTSRQC